MGTCRLCMCEDEDVICVTRHNELPLRIKSCVSVEINTVDPLPQTVCYICIQKVNDWHNFKQMCIKSNERLALQIEECKVFAVKCENESKNKSDKDLPFSGEYKNEIKSNKLDDFSEGDEDKETTDFEEPEEFISENYYDNQVKVELIPSTYTCEICIKEHDTIFDYLEHQDEHNGQPVFNCDKCSQVFTRRLDLVEHENKHKKPCPKCGKIILKSSMKTHLIQHTDRHVCAVCSHKFGSKAILRQHIITVHTDIKDHVCEACGKRFSTKTAMNVHAKTHQEVREYRCKVCNYAGRTSSAIYTHMATHANEMHSCEVCPKTFKSARNLYDHQRRVHSQTKKHNCLYCDKKFVDRYMMMIHMRTHTGVRPYTCDICDKTFNRSDSLKEHLTTHGSRMLYDCNQCLKKFTSKRSVGRHHCNTSAI